MQDISTYAASNDKLRLLLQGPPGTGKTALACQMPGAYVIDVDVNLGGALRWLKESKLQLPVGYDVIDKLPAEADGKIVDIPMPQRFARLDQLLIEAQKDPKIQTIIVDSGTTLCDVMIAEVLRQQAKSEMSKREWGFFAVLGKKFLATLSAMRKHVVFIVHEKTNTDEKGNIIYPVEVAWPGQVGDIMGAFFTNVWRAEVEIVPSGMNQTYKWQLRTMPEYKYKLKNTLMLPAKFEFKWETIQAALDKAK